MKEKLKNSKGITLVALVVTIIILIILAGISIGMLAGQDGLISKVQKAKENMELATIEEQEQLNTLYDRLETGAGYATSYDIVASMNNFRKKVADAITNAGITTAQDASDETIVANIGNLKDSSKTVNYITVSDGTVPVPKSFYYVGGNLATGVVISDNYDDSYDKNGKDMSAHSEVYNLVGNQFVWIPCNADDYHKISTWQGNTQYYTSDSDLRYASSNWDTLTNSAELEQIKKYGGFYVARFEAGLGLAENNVETIGNSNKYNSDGTPLSKAGVVPWNFISWTQAQSNSIRMKANDDYVTSGLITGTQWDVMLNKIYTSDNTKSLISSGTWGNYYDSENFTYYGRYATYNSSTTKLSAFSTSMATGTDNKNTYTLLTTGATDRNKGYNIYDVAGNLWEWTEETSFYGGRANSIQYRELRGGSCGINGSLGPACYRAGNYAEGNIFNNVGFRVVLYLK